MLNETWIVQLKQLVYGAVMRIPLALYVDEKKVKKRRGEGGERVRLR